MKPDYPSIILASASPRRAELLRGIGLRFSVRPTEIDEMLSPGETPDEGARRLAQTKAEALSITNDNEYVIGCDTIVVIDGEALGKPVDADDARRMLRLLSGRDHDVITAVAVAGAEKTEVDACRTRVRFARLSEEHINWYILTDEPFDKAGAYGIQGRASLFIEEIEGSYSNVVGLPVQLLPPLFARHDIDLISVFGKSRCGPDESGPYI